MCTVFCANSANNKKVTMFHSDIDSLILPSSTLFIKRICKIEKKTTHFYVRKVKQELFYKEILYHIRNTYT